MRHIVFIGNCQIVWLHDVYRRFIAPSRDETVTCIRRDDTLSAAARTALATADLIVEPRLSFTPDLDFGDIPIQGVRHPFPLVTANFLWPFGCRPHPNNAPAPGLPFGPYPDELGDAYLNRMLAKGISPEAIVEHYLNLDVPRVLDLDRLFEIWRDLQRRRDMQTGYQFAELIETRFRYEPLFFTRHHPGVTVFRAMIEQFLTRMGVSRDQVEKVLRRVRDSPFGPDSLPIHPNVAQHFGIAFATADYRYEQRPEGKFTFQEYVKRYVQYVWNPKLAAGLAAFHAGQGTAARADIVEGLRASPMSASGHGALSHLSLADGDIATALAEAQHATVCDDQSAQLQVHLGHVLARNNDSAGAEVAFQRAICLAPDNPGGHIALSHLLFSQRRLDESHAAVTTAIALEPEVADFHAHLSHVHAGRGEMQAAVTAMHEAMRHAPGHEGHQARLNHLIAQMQAQTEAALLASSS